LASEYWHNTPSFGRQFGSRWRCARAATAADNPATIERRDIVTP
jgi:hypothetical protein